MYMINFPIGDWSHDGHKQCDWYLVKSNKPVEEVREVHFKMRNVLGFTIHDFATSYEDNEFPKKIIQKLEHFSLDPRKYISDEDEEKYTIGPNEMLTLWIDLLMLIDPNLILEEAPDYPSINFYGFDEQGRSFNFVGYGCFS